MELVVEGRTDEGVAELEQAYEILPHPNVLYNIARAYADWYRYPRVTNALYTLPTNAGRIPALAAFLDG